MKYTKKPVTIDAVLWTGIAFECGPDFAGWLDAASSKPIDQPGAIWWNKEPEPGPVHIRLNTGGLAQADPGDYIICGIDGQIYPCKADVFEASHVEGTGLTIGISDETALNELTKLQSTFGYKTGEVDIIALLGLFGEAGEVLGETHTTDFNFEEDRTTAVMWAHSMDNFKKKIRSQEMPKLHVHVSDLSAFDTELADCFYYLNILATNRNLTLNQLAQISLDKIKAKKAKALG